MSDLSPGAVRRAIDDLSIEIARLKLEVKAKKNARRALRKLLRKARAKESTAASVSEPRKGKPEPGKDASRTVPQASHADIRVEGTSGGSDPSRTTGGSHQQPALRTGVASGVVDTPSPEVAASRARKPSPETSEAEPVRQAGGNAKTLIDLVRATYREHPDWTARQIATHLDRPINSVTTYLTQVRHEVKRAEKPAENAPAPSDASEAPKQPEPENGRPAFPVSPPEASETIPAFLPVRETADTEPGDQRAAVSGKRFWLMDDAGRYLNRYGTGFTADRKQAWDGNERQLAGIRRSVAIARDLREKPVTKDIAVPVNREVA